MMYQMIKRYFSTCSETNFVLYLNYNEKHETNKYKYS